jgi:hypothetical protein
MRRPFAEVVLPDRRVPVGGTALEQLRAPDVVDEHVDVAVSRADPLGEAPHLAGVEMVDGDAIPVPPKLGDELGRLSIVSARLYSDRAASRAATGANHRRAGFAQRGRDPAPGATSRAGYDGHATTKRVAAWRPFHGYFESRGACARRRTRTGASAS